MMQLCSKSGVLITDIIFTSGGTEANNLVLHTAFERFHASGLIDLPEATAGHSKPHIITSSLEHDSIRLVLENYQQQGRVGKSCSGPDAEWQVVS